MPNTSAPRVHGRRWLAALGLAGAFALFVAGTVELFQLRFETGDVYPAYSTLRSDPLGAAAFYEALEGQPGVRVERNLRPLSKLGKGPPKILGRETASASVGGVGPLTCFYLGLDPYRWPFEIEKPGVERLEEILRAGGRVVITFQPGTTLLTDERLKYNRQDRKSPSPTPSPKSSPAKKGENESERKDRQERMERMYAEMAAPDLIHRWGLDFRRDDPKRRPKITGSASPSPAPMPNLFGIPTPTPTPVSVAIAQGKPAVPVPGGPLADTGNAPWHTALDFKVDTREARVAGWHALATRDGQPVIVARPYGVRGGELVLASDSYFLSNEALRAEPDSGLLAALVGPGRRVIFDESHQGVSENPGMMTLARRYGLQGALAAVGLLVGLFIWRNASSLVPPPAPEESAAAAGAVLGRESAAGFLNLVKRGVPPRELIGACLAQWQGGAGGRAPDAAVVERLRAVAAEETARPAGQRSAVRAYQAMCAAVKPRG